MSDTTSCYVQGLTVTVSRGKDGVLVAELTGPEDEDLLEDGNPKMRIWLNEAKIYDNGEVGDNLP
jgi:hypothetical protein